MIHTVDDNNLVKASRGDDASASESLVLRYQAKMFNVAFRIVGDYDDACEVTRDAFVSAFRALKDFRGDSRFSTWLTAITMNLSRTHLAGNSARNRHSSLDDPPEGEGGKPLEIASAAPSAEEDLHRVDVRSIVRECMERLSPEFREVIVLRDLEEYPYEEIATILKLAGGTVKSRLARARDGMKDRRDKVSTRPDAGHKKTAAGESCGGFAFGLSGKMKYCPSSSGSVSYPVLISSRLCSPLYNRLYNHRTRQLYSQRRSPRLSSNRL